MQAAISEEAIESFWSFASAFPGTVFVTVNFFVDESREHGIAGVAGFLASRESWAAFCGEWREMLAREEYKVPEFRFSEFADKINGPNRTDWPYHGWSEEKRRKFLFGLADIAGRHKRFGIGAFFDVEDFRQTIPEWFLRRYPHPQEFCLKLFFESVLHQVEGRWPLPDADTDIPTRSA